ncbi:hypothetical protein G5V59_18395 [Nocardioides sp. W3-2-3]|uniref:hypothetical protein n=1 Tax=Nocardioides convexus TaxID=2712224 RepID=UPI00241837C3|nr:hypothetical protein [Nocardioides convexus]NHA01162.1 hypothetical protein [Nocardioides convexus]
MHGRTYLSGADAEVSLNVDPDDGSDADRDALVRRVAGVVAITSAQWREVVEQVAVEIEDAVGEGAVAERTDLRDDLLIRSVVVLPDAVLLSFEAAEHFPRGAIRVRLDDDLQTRRPGGRARRRVRRAAGDGGLRRPRRPRRPARPPDRGHLRPYAERVSDAPIQKPRSFLRNFVPMLAFMLVCGVVGPVFLVMGLVVDEPGSGWLLPTGIGITVLDVLIALLVARGRTRSQQRTYRLRARGRRARGHVLSFDQTNVRINDQPLVQSQPADRGRGRRPLRGADPDRRTRAPAAAALRRRACPSSSTPRPGTGRSTGPPRGW